MQAPELSIGHTTSIRIKLLICLCLTVVVCNSYAQTKNLEIPRIPLTIFFDPSEYGGGIQNWSIDQDTTGILYVANNYGVLEFDGGTWNSFNFTNSTRVRSLLISEDQRVFVGGPGQMGYFTKSMHGLHFVSLLERLPESSQNIEEVWNIIETGDSILFSTTNKLFALVEEEFTEIEIPGPLVRSLKTKSSVVAQFSGLGLFELKNGSFIRLNGTQDLSEEIHDIIEQDGDLLCFSQEGGIYRYTQNSFKLVATEIDDLLRAAAINTAIPISKDRIAIGTQNEGLFILNEELELLHHFTKNKGIDSRTVISLMEDDFENLWVGLNNGINYVELSSPLSFINEQVGLEGTGYTATVFQGQPYLGTNNGLFVQGKVENGISDYQLIPGSDGQVYNLSIVNDELILNHHRGAFTVDKGVLSQFFDIGSWKFIPTSQPGLIIGGNYEGLAFFRETAAGWQKVKDVVELQESSRILEFENDSVLWMTHGYKGAYRVAFDKEFEVKKVDFFGSESGFPSNILISVYELNDNLIFTAESGIYNFNEDSSLFNRNDFLVEQLGTSHVSNITTGANGDIFFLSNRELGYLKRESFGTYKKEQNIFKRINKYISDDLENISVLDDQNILIGAKEGFIHFDPTVDFKIKGQFDVNLRSIDVEFPEDSTVTILGGFLEGQKFSKNHSMTFRFAAPYFDGFEDLQYAYRLVGFDDHWSDWSSSTTKEYTNLPSGQFTFEIKAKNVYGAESSISITNFKVLPKWYQSNWAYLSYALLALMSFGFLTFFQDKRYRKEKKQLHQSKEEAIKSKDAELTQVSQRSKEEIENLKNEKLRSEIDYKNNELASVTMHLLNKNEFVNGVKKRIETLVNENGSSKEELKRIIKTIDKNLQEDDSWDQFAFHFDQVHGDFLKNLSSNEIKLTPQETKLAAYLRMNMSSKEIANLMNISVRGVELARYRLRKKFKLERDQNLVEHLLHL